MRTPLLCVRALCVVALCVCFHAGALPLSVFPGASSSLSFECTIPISSSHDARSCVHAHTTSTRALSYSPTRALVPAPLTAPPPAPLRTPGWSMDCADIKCGSCRKSVVRPLAQRYVCADCPMEVDENGDPTMFGTMGVGGGVAWVRRNQEAAMTKSTCRG